MSQPSPNPVSPQASSARDHVSAVSAALSTLDLSRVERIADALHAAHHAAHTVYCVGNGGSAALANHFAADLARLTDIPGRRRQVKVVSLAANASCLTAAANDQGTAEMFVDQLRGRLEPGDVVVGFSTSGASPNVLRALDFAREVGAVATGVTGSGGDELRAAAETSVTVDSTSVQVIEDVTSVVAHLLCTLMHQRRVAAGD